MLTDRWFATVQEGWPLARAMPPDVAATLQRNVPLFIDRFRWEAANEFTFTDDVGALIAAQACLLTGDAGPEVFARSGPIIVHGDSMVTSGERRVGATGVVSDTAHRLDGQAEFRGPVALAWPAVVHDARHPRAGRNVVIHEFAHQLDMDDGILDGTPARLQANLRTRWQRVFSAEYQVVRNGQPSELREYAGTDPGEFFAVACETFFSRPEPLAQRHPALYELLRRHFGHDPASWSR